jgi:guanine deaminase
LPSFSFHAFIQTGKKIHAFGDCKGPRGNPQRPDAFRRLHWVWTDTDITAHAEIVALRKACKKLGKLDLSDCAIYSTLEPCPMCFSAIHWARIPFIVYGASIADAKRGGFNELEISNEKMKNSGGLKVKLAKGFMKKDCVSLFKEWGARKGKKAY